MPEIGIPFFLFGSIALGLIVAWRVALKHRALYATVAGVLATVVLYGLLFWRASYFVAEAVKAGCWEWCGMEYVLYGAMAVITVIVVLIGGSVVAVLVRRRDRMSAASKGS